MSFEWSESFVSGHAEVDAAKKTLLQACQELGATDNWIALRPMIVTLYKQMKTLFALEEAQLQAIGAANLDAHRQQHADYLERLADRSTDVGKGHMNKKAIMKVMTQWAEVHVPTVDAASAAFGTH